jgi:hypothetical protein
MHYVVQRSTKTELQMAPLSQTQTGIQESHLSTHWSVRLMLSSACLDLSRASPTHPLHTLRRRARPKSPRRTKDKCRSRSTLAHAMLASSAPYTATAAPHMEIILFAVPNPTARITVVVATVAYSHLLYNQSTPVTNMQMEILSGTIES